MGLSPLVFPLASLLVTALAALAIDALAPARRRLAAWIGTGGAAAAAGLALWAGRGVAEGASYAIDGAALFASVGTSSLLALFCLWAAGAPPAARCSARSVALASLAGTGALALAGARDWITLLLAAETAVLPLVLMLEGEAGGAGRGARTRLIVTSAAASMTAAYGVSFLLAETGSAAIASPAKMGPAGWLGAALVTGGLLVKLGAAPFDVPVRRAFAGSPAWAVALSASLPKIGLAVALARAVEALGPSVPYSGVALYAAGAFSMAWAIAAGLRETDARELSARAGALNAGFVLLGLAAGGVAGLRSAVFYALAYALPALGLMLVCADEGSGLADLSGLSRRRRASAVALTVFIVSLVGVAPTVGFLGKLYLLSVVVRAGGLWPALAGIAASLAGAVPLGRLVRAVFSGEEPSGPSVEGRTGAATAAVFAASVLTIVLGIVPALFIASSGSLLP